MSETAILRVGDVVSLKSGGPKMTVAEIVSPTSSRCIWFADNKIETGEFVPDTLFVEK